MKGYNGREFRTQGFRQFAKGVVENSSVNDSTQTKHSLSPVSALAAIVPEGGRNLTQG